MNKNSLLIAGAAYLLMSRTNTSSESVPSDSGGSYKILPVPSAPVSNTANFSSNGQTFFVGDHVYLAHANGRITEILSGNARIRYDQSIDGMSEVIVPFNSVLGHVN